jgi:hypothetical protein
MVVVVGGLGRYTDDGLAVRAALESNTGLTTKL